MMWKPAPKIIATLRNARKFIELDKSTMIDCGTLKDEDGKPVLATMSDDFAREIEKRHDPLLAEIDTAIAVLEGR